MQARPVMPNRFMPRTGLRNGPREEHSLTPNQILATFRAPGGLRHRADAGYLFASARADVSPSVPSISSACSRARAMRGYRTSR
jgi:hypothetical protein